MILEQALLHIRKGQSAAFEAAMAQAKPLIAASAGFLGFEVRPAARQADLYLLTVRWDCVASHEEGFRKSDRYAKWRELLHGFYDPMPEVIYFEEPVIS
ncbi:antibiotic biosynthesis monooxygenase family protein [Sphingorhabdus arenilitoris]|uniref:Antibiotic biosynthesis monooxygenase family protein n=1 Tax=Sphingorhabdus arenilitoris TaxID=1490041 RepID=A0ABV8RDK5_9SPHN